MSQQNDATFVTTVDETEKEALSPRGTYIIPKGASVTDGANATFNVDAPVSKSKVAINDQTVVVSAKAVTAKTSASSIMTEDDSDTETTARKYGPKSKKDPKELFK